MALIREARILRPLIVDGISMLNSYKRDFTGVEQELPNGNILPLCLLQCINRGHRIIVVINKREVRTWSNNDSLKVLNVVKIYRDHFEYKVNLITAALRHGGLVISNDSFEDVLDALGINRENAIRLFRKLVVNFSIDYRPFHPQCFTFAFQVGLNVVFHLNDLDWFLTYNDPEEQVDYFLALDFQLKPRKKANIWDRLTKWLAFYNFTIYEYFNVQRQNYMGLKKNVPLPKTFRLFHKVVTKKLTILETMKEEDEEEIHE